MQRIRTERQPFVNWLIPLCLGFLCIVAIFKIYAVLNPTYPTFVMDMSKTMRLSPREASEIDIIHKTADSGQLLSEKQWSTVQLLFDSKNVEQERYGLLILCLLNKTKYREKAIRYAGGCLDSTDSFVKAGSLTALAKLHDTRWKGIAIQNQYSTDPIVKKSAVALLERQDRFK